MATSPAFTYTPTDHRGRPTRQTVVVRAAADGPPFQGPEEGASGYPSDGAASDVLAWVGYDPRRAKAAVVAEHDRDQPRTALLRELSRRTG